MDAGTDVISLDGTLNHPESGAHMADSYPTIAYQPPRLSEEDMRAAARRFYEASLTRRSVRDFAPDVIPDEVLALAISTASAAPSGANMQPWSFVVVKDADLKRRIRAGAEEEEKKNYSGRMSEEWLRALSPLQTDWRKEFLEIAPALIVVFRQDYHLEGERHVRHYYVTESVGIACGFLLAALNIAGLATLTHTPSPMAFLRHILDRPAWEKPYLLIPVGYPAEDCRVPDIRKKSLEEVLIWR